MQMGCQVKEILCNNLNERNTIKIEIGGDINRKCHLKEGNTTIKTKNQSKGVKMKGIQLKSKSIEKKGIINSEIKQVKERS